MRHSHIRHAERGFTLVEVLIALTLTVVMSGLLFGSLHTFTKSGRVAQAHLAAKEHARSAQQFLRTQLREIVPLSVQESRTLKHLFYADEKTIIFVSHIPRHRSAGGLHRNALFVKKTDSAETLSFGYERLQPLDDETYDNFSEDLPANTRALIEGAETITFDFFGRLQPDDDPTWHDRWDDSAQLPELARIQIERAQPTTLETIVTRIYTPVPTKHIALTLQSHRRLQQQKANNPKASEITAEPGIVPDDAASAVAR